MIYNLTKGEYSRKQLEEIFNTTDLSHIKRSMDRLGYSYETNGKRGDNYKLTIKSFPSEFKMICIEELGFTNQTDFDKLEQWMYLMLNDDYFQQLPARKMEEILNERGTPVSRQTIGNWIHKLDKLGFLHIDSLSCSYYCYDDKVMYEIPKARYSLGWRLYWAMYDQGYDYWERMNAMIAYVGGRLMKKPSLEKNGIFNGLYDRLNKAMKVDGLTHHEYLGPADDLSDLTARHKIYLSDKTPFVSYEIWKDWDTENYDWLNDEIILTKGQKLYLANRASAEVEVEETDDQDVEEIEQEVEDVKPAEPAYPTISLKKVEDMGAVYKYVGDDLIKFPTGKIYRLIKEK